jgi:quinoprotein glucose dehydrogenase
MLLRVALARPLTVTAVIFCVAAMTPTDGVFLQEAFAVSESAQTAAPKDWPHYGGTLAGQRYSLAREINRENVGKLQLVWTYHTGEEQGSVGTTFEVTPLNIGDSLYLCTPHSLVISLDAETGAERWRYDPQAELDKHYYLTCRGVAFYGDSSGDQECAKRILAAVGDGRLIAIDAVTGHPCVGFGRGGTVDLRERMGKIDTAHFGVSSAPTVTKGLVVVGGGVIYSEEAEPPGVVRAYDAKTGALVWNWIPEDPENTVPLSPTDRYPRTSPNAWAPPAVDEELGLIYVPTSVAKPNEWGGARKPDVERFSSSVVALDIATGRVRWAFQTVHHDVWDLDQGAQPSLVDIETRGGRRKALIAASKTGDILVLDRATGAPIVPVAEEPAPQGAPPGDWLSATQPRSQLT